MRAIKSIVRIFSVLLVTLSLSFGALGGAHAQASASTGLSAADWKQIKALIPATTINAQQAYLKASNTETNADTYSDCFGYSLAISGDTLVVGALYEDSNATGVNGDQTNDLANDSGAVYVFTRSGSSWSQQAYLKASNTEADDNFGYAVSISGDTIVVGAEQESSQATGINGNQTDNTFNASGAVYVFTRSGTDWSQQAYIKASNTGADDNFGSAVAISGDTLAVGTPSESSNASGVNGNQTNDSLAQSGAVYVFTRTGSAWSQQAYIKASNPSEADEFGLSVSLDANTVAVGAFGEASNATGVNGAENNELAPSSGAAYIFTRSGGSWSQQAYIKASNTGEDDKFGLSVAIAGDTLAVGAPQEDSNASGVNGDQSNNLFTDSGAAYIFTRSSSHWSQQTYLKASNAASGSLFGNSVAISGNKVVAGAIGESSNTNGVDGVYSGAAYVFTRNDNLWKQQAFIKASNAAGRDYFGRSIAMDGDTVVAGAPYEDSNATGVNGDQENDSTKDAGAAYVSLLPPLVTASLRVDANPTIATKVNFNVSFSEPMTGVDVSDFHLTTTGTITGASITNFSGGPVTYHVTVAVGSGDGTIRLDVLDNDSIKDADFNPLGGTGPGNGDFTIGEVYTIDRTGPAVISILRADPNPTNLSFPDFNVHFNEAVTGVDVSDFHLTTTGVTGAFVSDVTPDPEDASKYVVSVGSGLHIGNIRLDVVDNDSIVDVMGNPLGGKGAGNGNFTKGETYYENRTFTVTFNSIAAQDGWVLESSENSNTGGTMNATAKTFPVGDDAANRQYRAILSFDTKSIPDNAIIKAATIKIIQSGAVVGKNPFSTLGALWADIRKGPFGTAALRLGDFNALVSAAKVGYFSKVYIGTYTSTLNAAGRSNINKLGLTQFRLHFAKDDNNNRKADFMKFVSDYYSGNKPMLTITYSVP